MHIIVDQPLWRNRAGTLPGSPARLRDDLLSVYDGFWLNGWDKSVLSQDAAGTVPVTDVAQPVLHIADKSGRDRHAVQSNATIAPNYTGVDAARGVQFTTGDYLEIPLPLSGQNSFTCVMAVNITGGSSRKTLMEGYGNPTTSFHQISLEIGTTGLLTGLTGSTNTATTKAEEAIAYPLSSDQIVSLHYDAVGALLTLRRNGLVKDTGIPAGSWAAADGVRIFANRTPDRYSEGKLYDACFVRAATDPAPIEAFMAARLGVTLGV